MEIIRRSAGALKSKKCAIVDKNRCVACGACVHECPRQAINIWKGCFAKIDTAACVGCGKCETVCPAGSIEIKKWEDNHE